MRPARVAAIAALATGVLMVAIQVVGADLATAAAPFGLVSLQLTADPSEAAAILASWEGALRPAALRAHALDLVLPVAYGTATVAAGLAIARGRAASTPAARRARLAGRIGAAAAVLDQVENAAMGVTLLVGPGPRAGAITLAAALGKWTLLVVSLSGLALASARSRPVRLTR